MPEVAVDEGGRLGDRETHEGVAQPEIPRYPFWVRPRLLLLVALLALTLPRGSLAAVPFRLPVGEAVDLWLPALGMGGFVVDGARAEAALVELVDEGGQWRLRVRTADGQLREAIVRAPDNPDAREDIVWLATSLLQSGSGYRSLVVHGVPAPRAPTHSDKPTSAVARSAAPTPGAVRPAPPSPRLPPVAAASEPPASELPRSESPRSEVPASEPPASELPPTPGVVPATVASPPMPVPRPDPGSVTSADATTGAAPTRSGVTTPISNASSGPESATPGAPPVSTEELAPAPVASARSATAGTSTTVGTSATAGTSAIVGTSAMVRSDATDVPIADPRPGPAPPRSGIRAASSSAPRSPSPSPSPTPEPITIRAWGGFAVGAQVRESLSPIPAGTLSFGLAGPSGLGGALSVSATTPSTIVDLGPACTVQAFDLVLHAAWAPDLAIGPSLFAGPGVSLRSFYNASAPVAQEIMPMLGGGGGVRVRVLPDVRLELGVQVAGDLRRTVARMEPGDPDTLISPVATSFYTQLRYQPRLR